MKNEFTTIKIWKKTLSKLRLISGMEEKSIVSILDRIVADYEQKLQKNKQER